MCFDHENVASRIEDECADGHYGVGGYIWFGFAFVDSELEVAPIEKLLKFAEMFHDQVRTSGAELSEAVIASEHRARLDASMFGRLDIVLHVADKQRLVWNQAIFFDNLVDFGCFI